MKQGPSNFELLSMLTVHKGELRPSQSGAHAFVVEQGRSCGLGVAYFIHL